MTDPVSIRTGNPGAQWLGPIAKQFGATDSVPLPGGNNAAVFPDPESGAAAQFALLGQRYAGMPLSTAISRWSGGNSSPAYTAYLSKQTGLTPDTVLTPELLAGPQGLALVKAQSHWEAGKDFPLTDEQWQSAQSRAFGSSGQQGSAQPQQAPSRADLSGVQSLSGSPSPVAPATAAAAPGAPPAASGPPSALPGMPSGGLGMLAGQMPTDPNAGQSQTDPNLDLLMQHAQAMMQAPQQAPPPMAPLQMPSAPGQLAARLRAAAMMRGGLTGGV